MRKISLAVAVLATGSLFAQSAQQEFHYYDADGLEMQSITDCERYTITTFDPLADGHAVLREFTSGGALIAERHYSDYANKELHGRTMEYHRNGQVKLESWYRYGELDGSFKTFWQNGQLKRSDEYEAGDLRQGQCYDSTGAEVTYYAYSTMPVFPGGLQGLSKVVAKETKYPAKARKKNVEGTVYVSFVVTETGNVAKVNVLRGISDDLDAEAMRVVQGLANWTPGTLDGEPVEVAYTLPLKFELD